MEVVRSFSDDSALESAWNELWTRTNSPYHESYTVCRHAWEDLVKPQEGALHCVLVWDQNRLVLAWPLISYRRHFVKFLRPLTPSGGEANSILLDPAFEPQSILEQAWKAATSIPGCDIVYLPLLRLRSPLHSYISRCGVDELGRDAAPYARLTLEDDWKTYASSIGAGSWQQVSRKRKKIFQMEESRFLCIDPVKEPTLAAKWIEWMLAEKKVWAKHAHKSATWVDSPFYRNFLVHSICDARELLKYRLYAILVQQKPIAIKLVAVCSSHIEYVIGGYSSSPEIARLSPGMVLDEYWMEDVFNMNLDVDFGTGQEPYKLFWSRGNVEELRSYRVPISLTGKIILRSARQIQRYRARAA